MSKPSAALLGVVGMVLCWSNTATAAYPPVSDFVRSGKKINFWFTHNGDPIEHDFELRMSETGGPPWTSWQTASYGQLGQSGAGITNDTGHTRYYQFRYERLSGYPAATDWRQLINGDFAGFSDVYAANIGSSSARGSSPWEFYDLDLLPEIPWAIPDLAPLEPADPEQTIYTAVNLDLYLASNPFGFLDGAWSEGQTLQDLGLAITDGVIPGVQGIYWATSEFVFDPDPNGFGFVPSGGMGDLLNSDTYRTTIEVIGKHTPEPASVWLLACGLLALWRTRR